ncbi:MAG: death-on-curing protein [Asticcacaulis sp.]|nr:death-on-curing protein [Asticcacaulis sp.]
MPFVLIQEGVIEAIQAELAAEHGGRSGLRELSPIRIMHARAHALNDSTATDLASLAACYGYALAHDQLFHDANLSTALIATELFLSLNGSRLGADDTTCFLGFMVVGNGELSAEAFASWIRGHIVPQAMITA